jgi:hypothetical protein
MCRANDGGGFDDESWFFGPQLCEKQPGIERR